MTRGRKPLDFNQQEKLRAVAEADDAWRHAKKYAEQEARKVAMEKVAQFSGARDRAIYDAVRAGIPKNLIGTDGLDTKNPYAVLDAVRRVEELQQEVGIGLPQPHAQRFKWVKVLKSNESGAFGWISDTADTEVVSKGIGGEFHPGYFIWVNLDANTTTVTRGEEILTAADGGYEELRAWALANGPEAP